MQCIGEAFGVDADDEAQKKLYSTKPANLLSIFDVYLKTKSSASKVYIYIHYENLIIYKLTRFLSSLVTCYCSK